MKTRFLIIIGIVVVMTFIVSVSVASLTINYPAEVLPIKRCDESCEELDIILQDVLDNCYCQVSGQACIEPELRWWNTTHYIDNIDCSWGIIDIRVSSWYHW